MLSKLFSGSRPRYRRVVSRDCRASVQINYAYHWNANTILFKNGWMMKVIKLDGFSFETADDEDVDIKKDIRNQILKSMAVGSLGLYFHLIRRKEDVFSGNFGSEFLDNFFIDMMNEEWMERRQEQKEFVNELYISVIRKSDSSGVASLIDIITKLKDKASKANREETIKEAHNELNEAVSRILAGFREYNARLLQVRRSKFGLTSEITGFLTSIVNMRHCEPLLVDPYVDISQQLLRSRLLFKRRFIEVSDYAGKRYGGIVSLKEYSNYTSAGMLDCFLRLPYAMVVTQSFQFINRQVAIGKMQLQQNRMVQTDDKAESQIFEISKAIDDATSGRVGYGLHHLTVCCCEDNMRSLDSALALADVEMANSGIYPVRENVNLEAAFWGQLPGSFDFIARKATISTLNLAGLVSLHNYPVGSKTGNHWGEAVTVLDTTSGTPFFFNFHVRDVGHTTIIGPTGAGKTVLMNFLCAQAMKFKPKLYFFDKDRGAEIFIRAVGGIYSAIQSRVPSGFNPLQLPDTADNRSFLHEWLQILLCANGEKINATDIETIKDAIDGNYKLKHEDRRLRNLAPFFGVGGPDTLAGRLAMWHSDGSHAAMFDNEKDDIDLTIANAFGFEMGTLLKDKASLSPVLLYIFHRISSSLDGSPCMIVLDEAWALIDNPVFAPRLKDWLKVFRKLNAMLVLGTQEAEDASKSAISGTLIQQTATQIFLPNMKATDAYKTAFMISDREYALIKTTDPGSRFFLVKQGSKAVVAKLDLGGMDNVISVLSGRSDTVMIMKDIIRTVGTEPKDWLPIFFRRIKDE